MTTPAIRATGLHKRFRATDGAEVVAVERVDLTIQPGEIVAFLGPNGAGKTTTVDMLLGLTSPTAGQVEIVGMTPRQAVEAGRVSAVMQTGGLLPDFTVGETVEAIAALRGRLDRVEEVIEMPGLTGIEAAAALRAELPGVRSLIVTTFGRPGYVRRALDAGAAGFVVKDTPAKQLADAVRRVHAGLRVIDPDLAAESLMAGPSRLTAREAEILAFSLDGTPVSAIAARAPLSEGTVRNHLSAAIGKTGATTRAEGARLAQANGWL
jgi:two-component system response regulator DesR